jgi:gamma-glutamyltranspeptidase/glutathione hydrolase
MVVSASSYASDIGRAVLQTGGNAVDAAVATGFAMAVTHPAAGNIGGGGFMVVRLPDGRSTTFEFREKAPLAAHAEMFLDDNGEYSSQIHHNSHLAVGVPGTVAGFALAHERMGSLSWSRLVQPAAELAREGFTLSEDLAAEFEGLIPRFQPYPGSMHVFTKNGEPYQAGETFRQPDLARTLGRIATHGPDGFYRGETAHWIALEMKKHGGMITLEDLAHYEANERDPIRGTYNGYEIITMPPPSSGGIALVEMLNILEPYDLASHGHNSAEYVHLLTEAMRRAYRDRATYVADADFVSVPIEQLTSKEYANELRMTIDPNSADESHPDDVMAASAATAFESPETTHYSVVDANGMAVSVTYTLEAGYGSKIVVPGAGFLLNNEMGDFNARPGLTTEAGLIGTEPNLARPEQRMLSSMTPTIIARDGQLVAVVGSPGGRTIINTVLQVTLNVAELAMDIQSAVNAPRFHHQWLPDVIRIEQDGITAQTEQRLLAMGHELRIGGTQGRSHSIMVDPVTGIIYGAPDPRDDDGAARGF